MTFRALIVGDIHFKGVNPRARLDNYLEAISTDLLETLDIARQHKVHAIIQSGDLFDGPNTAWNIVGELAYILQQSPCPFLAIHGNHDIFGGNAESKRRTPFGLLSRLGIIQDIEEQSSNLPGGFIITGCGFTTDTDTNTPAGRQQFCPEIQAPGSFNIHVVHSMLMDHAPGFDMRHTLISQVETDADVIVCGHLHTGFGNGYVVKRDDGALFINPGALCRLSAHQAEIDRTVQVALLTVDGNTRQADVKLIPLKSAQPGHLVLSRGHLEAETERSERLDKFLALLASEGASKFLEVRDIVEDIAARENVDSKVKDEVLRRIGEAREKLGAMNQGAGVAS